MSQEIQYLIEGYKKFYHKYFHNGTSIFQSLKNEQCPKILIIACSDSRVDPAIILNCQPGDLFVVRNVANLIPPYEDDGSHHGTSAALEFAVCGLGIKHIIILGHSNCGGIRSLVENQAKIKKGDFISKWMEIAKPAYEETTKNHSLTSTDQKITSCSHFALINSLKNLNTFPWISSKVKDRTLFLHSWYFDIETGIIEEFNPETNSFIDLRS